MKTIENWWFILKQAADAHVKHLELCLRNVIKNKFYKMSDFHLLNSILNDFAVFNYGKFPGYDENNSGMANSFTLLTASWSWFRNKQNNFYMKLL